MRISARLYLGFGLLLALMSSVAALVLFDVTHLGNELQELSTREFSTLEGDLQTSRYLGELVDQSRRYLASRDEWRLVAARSAEQLLEDSLARVGPRGPADRIEPLVIRQVHVAEAEIHRAVNQAAAGRPAAALATWQTRSQPAAQSTASLLEQLRRLRAEGTVSRAESGIAATRQVQSATLIAIVLALALTLIVLILLTRSLLVPIHRLAQAVRDFGSGDLATRARRSGRDEMAELTQVFNEMASTIGTMIIELNQARAELQAQNHALRETVGSIRSEMELAARIQRGILPSLPDAGPVLVAAEMTPASEIGGDFYDIMSDPNGDLVIVVGDVAGKGIAAAMMMVFLVTALREIQLSEADPGLMLEHLNRMMVARFGQQEEAYATCVVGRIDATSGEFTFAKAGHEEPIWFHSESGVCESLSASGLFLGAFAEARYKTRTIALGPEDRVLLFTDGIIEARGADGRAFEMDRLLDLVRGSGGRTPRELVDSIQDSVARWSGVAPMKDDRTLLVFGPSAGAAAPVYAKVSEPVG